MRDKIEANLPDCLILGWRNHTLKLIDAFKSWGLVIYLQKTEYVVFGEEGQELKTNQETIKLTEEYNYLGVTLTKDENITSTYIMKKVERGDQ